MRVTKPCPHCGSKNLKISTQTEHFKADILIDTQVVTCVKCATVAPIEWWDERVNEGQLLS